LKPLRSRLRWGAAALLVLTAAVLTHPLRTGIARYHSPTGEAAWIWCQQSSRQAEPQAFLAVRDFDLPALPARARLQVLGDEEYRLSLNGLPVGSGAWQEGATLDVYDVTGLLVVGGNRLLAELRSGKGSGGLLLDLQGELPGGEILRVVSDGEWRIFRTWHPGLAGGWLPVGPTGAEGGNGGGSDTGSDAGSEGGGEAPQVWGRPPMARWGSPRPGLVRPVPAPGALPSPLLLPRVEGPSPESSAAPGGAGTLYDWGREVEGYLTVVRRPEEALPGLVFVGPEAPRPEQRQADSFLLSPPRAPMWRDSRPRRFRHALILGAGPIESVAVLPAEVADREPALSPVPPAPILGVVPPPRLSPLEAEIRHRLRSVGSTESLNSSPGG